MTFLQISFQQDSGTLKFLFIGENVFKLKKKVYEIELMDLFWDFSKFSF